MGEEIEINEIHAHTDDELKKFVVDYCDQKIFILQEMEPREMSTTLHIVFMPLIAMKFSEEARNDVGTIYAYYTDRMGHMGVNGYPFFGSCRLMNKADWLRVRTAII